MLSGNSSITLLVTDPLLKEMDSFYAGKTGENPTAHIILFVQEKEFTLSAYAKEVKGMFRVLIQGKGAAKEAKRWVGKGAIYDEKRSETKIELPKAKKESTLINNRYPQIGSDEVGTGDYFGPVIVAASYVRKEDLPLLEELGVTDSKKMTDEKILDIGPKLIKNFPYSQLCLDNVKYNELYAKGVNLNEIKAKMHNRALANLAKKDPNAFRYMDQFAREDLYYSYLQGEKEIIRGITFKTKGELSFPSVALASVIARYSFLKHMEKMSENLPKPLPFGASIAVDEYAKWYLESHSIKELDAVSKANFANRKRILATDLI